MRRPPHRGASVGAAVTLLCVFAFTGCHKQPHRGYQPAAPDLEDQASADTPPRQTSTVHPTQTVPSSAATAPDKLPGKPSIIEEGLASWYGPPYAGRKGADGTVYDQNAMTAANLTLPLGSVVRVTNLSNNESVIVRITDRGPFVRGRIIDLSLAAAKATGVYRAGVAKVRIEAVTPPPSPTGIPGGRWCVQIGAFYNPEDAIQLKNDLTRRYATAKVIEFQGPTGYWVRINPKFADRSTANEIADSIHIPDAEPYLTRTD